MRIMLILVAVLFCAGASCQTMPSPATADGKQLARAARDIFGTSLIGAKGLTPIDQEKIDDSVAGACGAGAFTPSECSRHRTN